MLVWMAKAGRKRGVRESAPTTGDLEESLEPFPVPLLRLRTPSEPGVDGGPFDLESRSGFDHGQGEMSPHGTEHLGG
jgi:hypothetical protein